MNAAEVIQLVANTFVIMAALIAGVVWVVRRKKR